MPAETFKKHRLIDRVAASDGYSIRLRRDRIEYTDQLGTLVIDAEWAPGRGTWVMAFRSGPRKSRVSAVQGACDGSFGVACVVA